MGTRLKWSASPSAGVRNFRVSLLIFDTVVHAAVTGALAVLFLWFAFALLRQVRWHND
jgi:hypothetical protein